MSLSICKNCGLEVKSNMKTCPQCGGTSITLKCKNCGNELTPNEKMCSKCNYSNNILMEVIIESCFALAIWGVIVLFILVVSNFK